MNLYKSTAIAAALTLSLTACSQKSDVAEDSADATMDHSEQMAAASCDRQCIIDTANTYIAAMVAHDPSAAPLADDVVYVENVTAMTPGEGLWQSIVSGPDNFQLMVPDEINQSVGYLGMMTYMAAPPAPQGSSPEERAEWAASAEKTEQPVLVALRLQLEDGKITEAEHLLAGIRVPDPNAPAPASNGPARPTPWDNLQSLRPGLLVEIPADKRMDHDKLIAMGLSYYDALDDNDGTLMPFADDCERHENGMVTAGPDVGDGPTIPGTDAASTARVSRACGPQLSSKTFTYIDRIENRRVFAADPQTGLVMGLSHFRHPMDNLPYDVIRMDGSTVSYDKERMPFAPFDLPAAHIFKIGADGMVHEIEAMGFTAPYNSPTGWEDLGG